MSQRSGLVPVLIPSPPSVEQEISDVDFGKIARLVYDVTGIVLDDSRKVLVVGRLGKRLRARGVRTFREYIHILAERDPEGVELRHLVNCITTNKTSFFREAHHFDHLHAALVERMRQAETNPALRKLRIWSAGCSTGEEPYTIAMTVARALGPALREWDVRILATDVDTDVLAHARRGFYKEDRVVGLPAHARSAFEEVTLDGERGLRIHDDLRELVSFEVLNFMSPTWPLKGALDFIFCRNVTIYFDRSTQDRLYRRFAALLAPDGQFFAGHSENLTWLTDIFALRGTAIYVHAGTQPHLVAAPKAAGRPEAPKPAIRAAAVVKALGAPLAEGRRPTSRTQRREGVPVPASEVHSGVPEAAIQAGGVMASRTPLLIKTTLGSCISVCLYDPTTRMGGMNHFMLPGTEREADGSTRFGVHAMEVLINKLLALGADRRELVAKICGACTMARASSIIPVAARNLAFIEEFLALEGFPVRSRRVGGDRAMELRFRTDTGEAFVRTVDPNVTKRILEHDINYRDVLARPRQAASPDDGITWFQ